MTGVGAPITRSEAATLLGVDEHATAADVQRAYLRAARRTHPDLLPDAQEEERRAATAAFARLTSARDLLVTGRADTTSAASPGPSRVPQGAGRAPGRGLAGSLVVLTLLAFLLVAIVSIEQAFEGGSFRPPSSTSAP